MKEIQDYLDDEDTEPTPRCGSTYPEGESACYAEREVLRGVQEEVTGRLTNVLALLRQSVAPPSTDR